MNRQLSIAAKISLLVLTAIASTLVIVFLTAFFSLSGMKKTNQEELHQIIYQERKKKLVELTDNASVLLETTNFQMSAITAITAMRFGKEKKNYFFIVDEQGQFIVHPQRPELVGTRQLNLQSYDKKYIIKEIIHRARTDQSGFISYLWEKPHLKGVMGEKLSYFKRIPKWKWIIGTGIYTDDIKDIALEKERFLWFDY